MSHVLFIGGEKGSWEVRGCQIGRALGARVTVNPSTGDFRWADVIVLVKRAIDQWGERAQETRLPLIWDVLDYWKQPEENAWTAGEHLLRIADRRFSYGVSAVIGATQAMADDIHGLYIPHHSRSGLVPTPPRHRLEIVAYEGRVKYLGSWVPALEKACQRLGAQFIINPSSLAQADVVVAFRGEPWDGWACRQWKSGVKYVNALVAGRPIVTQPCKGFYEVAPAGRALEHAAHLEMAIREAWEVRQQAYEQGRRRAGEFSLDAIAKQYRRLCQSVLRKAA